MNTSVQYSMHFVAPSSCMVVNGKTVCPSPDDAYNVLHGPNTSHYRDDQPYCLMHVVVNNQNGQIEDIHTNAYNPNDDLFDHGMGDVIPDFLYMYVTKYLTETYWIPAASDRCPQ